MFIVDPVFKTAVQAVRCHKGQAEMSEAKKRTIPTPAFKAKVGLEAVRGGKTINDMGQEYGVPPVQVGLWKKAIQAQAKTLFKGKRGPKPTAAHREPELLFSEIGNLKVALDWLVWCFTAHS